MTGLGVLRFMVTVSTSAAYDIKHMYLFKGPYALTK